MTHNPSRALPASLKAQAELELLQLILNDEISYPWNPTELGADAYFAELEQEVVATGWTVDELDTHAQRLATALDQAWSTLTPAVAVKEALARSVNVELFQKFIAQVPQHLLEGIVRSAQQIFPTQLSLSDQLVQCVQSVLPEWGAEDLQVLARPFAYAMRGEETNMLEAALRSVRCAAWTELSGIEQARLSLAIARYALAQRPAGSAH